MAITLSVPLEWLATAVTSLRRRPPPCAFVGDLPAGPGADVPGSRVSPGALGQALGATAANGEVRTREVWAVGRLGKATWLVILALLAGLVAAFIGMCCLTAGPDIAFDATSWRDLEDLGGPLGSQFHGYNRRARMVHDLLGHHLRVGMRWGEARAFLGQATEGGDGQYFYLLLQNPRLDQECAALVRWGTTDPRLKVEIDREDGSLDAKVTAIRVVRR